MTGRPGPVTASLAARPATGGAAGASHLTFWVLVSVACLAVAYSLLFSPILGLCGFAAVSALAAAQSLLWSGRRRLAIVLILGASPAVAAFGLEIGRGRSDAAVQMEMVLLGLAATAVLVEAPIVGAAGFALVAGAIVGHLESGRSASQEVALGGLAFAVGIGLVVIVARVRDRERLARSRMERDLAAVTLRLKSGHERLLRQQQRLVALGQVLEELPIEPFLEQVVAAGAAELGVECAQVCESPAQGAVLRVLASFSREGKQAAAGTAAIVEDRGSGFAPLSTMEFVQLAEGRWAEFRDQDGLVAAASPRVSFLASPFQAASERAGFLVFQSTDLARQWSPEDRMFALSLAGLVTLAEEHDRRVRSEELLEDRTHYLTALTELLPRLLEPYAMKDLLQEIVESGARLVGCEDGYLGLVEGDSMVPRVGIGLLREFEGVGFERGQGVGGRVWESGRPETVHSYAEWEGRAEDKSRLGIQAVICVPLTLNGQVEGVLGVVSRRVGRRFGEVETAILERFADLAALALQRARLIEDLNRELTERQAAGEEVRRLNGLLEARVAARTQELGRVSGDLETSRNHMRTILESAPEGIVVLNAAGRVLDANPAAVAMLAAPQDAILGSRLADLMFSSQRAALDALVERAAAGHRGGLELDIRPVAGGEPLWVEAQLAPLPRERERESHVLLLLRDITERRAAESERGRLGELLERSARDWQVTFDAVEDVVLLAESSGSILRCNRAAQERAGLPFDRILAATLADLPPEEPWLALARVAPEALDTMTNRSLIVRGSDGFSWDVSASPLITGEGRRVVLIARDVSPLQALQESLRKAETFSAIGTLVAGVAHEVRNPLFAMSANLDAFEEEVRGDDVISTYVGNLRLEMRRLERLMMGLLDYARPQGAAFAPCDLNAIVAGAVRACRARSEAGRVTIDFDSAVPVGRVAADADQLLQVIQILLDNALQHSPPGSRVRIGLERRGAPGLRRSAVVIKDSGPGLREEDIPRLFEPFFTRRRGGIGLGLSIAQRIVEQHQGSIWARNRPEGGAEFCVELPAE